MTGEVAWLHDSTSYEAYGKKRSRFRRKRKTKGPVGHRHEGHGWLLFESGSEGGRGAISLISQEVEQKFVRLKAEWKAKRGPASSMTKLVMHPSYQTIIGMGREVVPLLLRELERDPDVWFWALRAITEANPVPSSARGNVREMAIAWIKWGREQGYQW